MQMKVMSWVVAASVAFLPVAQVRADDHGGRNGRNNNSPAVQLNPGAVIDNIQATIQGRNGAPEPANLAFTLAGFAQGLNNAICAVGTLRSATPTGTGAKLPPTSVAFPVQTSSTGPQATQADCAGVVGNGDDRGDDVRGGFGATERKPTVKPALYATPQSVPVQNATYDGTAPRIVLAQFPPPCNILNLTLGPLTLNVLGLVVIIPNPIVVNIIGVPALGLLGQLLCGLLGP